VVGHILFTPVTIDPPAAIRVARLAPMSVLPTYQREGIGGQLVRAGLEETIGSINEVADDRKH
jgi:putative acetyltransferase